MPDDDRSPASRPRPQYGLPGPAGSAPGPTGSSPVGVAGPAQTGAAPSAPRGRRRGLVPLLLGLLSLLLGGVALVTGFVIGLGSMAGTISSGLQAFDGTSTTVTAQADEVYVVYVPADHADMSCTATGADPGAVQTVPTSGRANIGPGGQAYEQRMGVVATSATRVTVTCDGPGAGVIGPVGMWRVATPILVGLGIGALLGILGLVLAIVGIVRLARGRRP